MNREFTLFIVDDAEPARIMLEDAFGMEYRVHSFETAEDCLAFMDRGDPVPDIFLLDVDLPGMDGYTLCRRIIERPGMANIPAIFISGLDDDDSRLEGYDAGGIDYVVKPYNINELKQKVGAALRRSATHLSLSDKVQESEMQTSMILANLDEYAALINCLRGLNECDSPRAVTDQLFRLLRAYKLETAIQIRLPEIELTLSEDGENRPLEVAVMNHVRTLERIFEFKMRAAYNYEHITILVNNMPRNDTELCGRLRDHLAIAAECADARLKALQTKYESTHARETAADLIGALQMTLMNFQASYAQARYCGSTLTQSMLDDLSEAFASLGLSEEQETRIEGIVHTKTETLSQMYDFGAETETSLSAIAQKLARILGESAAEQVTTSNGQNKPDTLQNSASVELF